MRSLASGPLEILPRRKQPHHQICRFDDVAAVVVLTERNGSAAVAIHPVRKGAVVALSLAEKTRHCNQAIERSLPVDPSVLDANKDRHDAEAGPAVVTTCGVALLRSRARPLVGWPKIPGNIERLSLHGVEDSPKHASGFGAPACLRPMEILGSVSMPTSTCAHLPTTPRAWELGP